mmetsp:Transcript_29547/g.73733  ORF Transcript_29547/g.73733 Transcript_29547/m.73733 type:complete len:247 (-) Transcript_29547:4169-4909(-)
METSRPRAANDVVSVDSSLSWNAARNTLNACTCGTWTPSLCPRATPPPRTISPSSAAMSSSRVSAECSSVRGMPLGSAKKTAINPKGIPALRLMRSLTPCPSPTSRPKSSSSHCPGRLLSSTRDERSKRSPRHVRPTRVFSMAPLCFMTNSTFMRCAPAAFNWAGSNIPSSDWSSESPRLPAPPGSGTARASSPVRSETSFMVSQQAVTTICALGANDSPGPASPSSMSTSHAASSSSLSLLSPPK